MKTIVQKTFFKPESISMLYFLMAIGLLISSIISFFITIHDSNTRNILATYWGWGLLIIHFSFIFTMDKLKRKLNHLTVLPFFLIFSATTGFSFTIFVSFFTHSTIYSGFVSIAGAFIILAISTSIFKNRLNPFATFLIFFTAGILIIVTSSVKYPSVRNGPFGIIPDLVFLLIYAFLMIPNNQKASLSLSSATIGNIFLSPRILQETIMFYRNECILFCSLEYLWSRKIFKK